MAGACGHRPVIELRELAHFNTSGWAHDVAVDHEKLYVADRQGGFMVFDTLFRYVHPRVLVPVKDVISLAPNSGSPLLASRFEGLVITSQSGQITGRFSNGDIANAVAVWDNLAFIAYGCRGLVVVRIADGRADLVSESATYGWSHDLRLSRGQALVADWSGLNVWDIRNPAKPSQISFVPSSATCISLAVRESGSSRTVALAEGNGGVTLVRLDRKGQASVLSRNLLGLNPSNLIHPKSGGWVHSVAWAGRYLLAANWKLGLSVMDVRDVRNPRLILQSPTSGTALGVKTLLQPDGSYLVFLADGESGLRVFHFQVLE